MIELLAKIFVKNKDDVKNPDTRNAYGVLCGAVGIFFNILLFAGKIISGLISRSVAIIADAFNNLFDVLASVVTLVGFKMSSKKPDEDHPFGHGRMEYIAGLFVSFLIIAVGFELFRSSIDAIREPKKLESSVITIATLSVAILVKFYMYFYNRKTAKKINSAAMEATAKDSLSDTISTFVVLLCIIVDHFWTVPLPLDGIAGIFVAIFILINGIQSIKDTIDPLLGLKANKEFATEIEAVVKNHPPIQAIHDLVIHDYGPGRLMISLHAEVPGSEDIFKLHEVIDDAENDLAKKFNCMATIHMDPIDTKNPMLNKFKLYIANEAKKIDESLSVHDVRMVPGASHTNVIFDAVRPHACHLSDAELKTVLRKKAKEFDKKFNAVIHIDNPFS